MESTTNIPTTLTQRATSRRNAISSTVLPSPPYTNKEVSVSAYRLLALLAVPNVTTHPSTASVTDHHVLLYNGLRFLLYPIANE